MKRFFILLFFVGACASQAKVDSGNSIPLTEKENSLYKQAMVRCHKTGGTRIVKINGKLRCF